MFELFFLSKIPLTGDYIRIPIAIIGLIIATYYDLFKNKNIPEMLVYGFLCISFAVNLIFFNKLLFEYSIIISSIIFVIFYIMYKIGFVGEADGYILTSISLLIPVYKTIPMNLPFITSVIINAMLFLSILFIIYIIKEYLFKKSGEHKYWLLFILYIPFLYFLLNTGIFTYSYIIGISILALSSVMYLVYKKQILYDLSSEISIDEINDEEVVALEIMKRKLPRVINKEIAKELKNKGIKTIYIYSRLPPFVPFILLGVITCLIYGDLLLNGIG